MPTADSDALPPLLAPTIAARLLTEVEPAVGTAGGPRRHAPASDDVVRTDDGSLTLLDRRYGETYRSRRGAHTEAKHVFLDGTGVSQRLAEGRATSVVEVGLGAATNLACTVAAALERGTPLRYEVWEPDPMSADVWSLLGLEEVAPPAFLSAWFGARASWGALVPGQRRVWRYGPVSIDLRVAPIGWSLDPGRSWPAGHAETRGGGGARTGSCDDAVAVSEAPRLVDAVYLDPFSPAVNPDAWTPDVLAALARRLAPGGVLATYTVAGAVRRALSAAGLQVRKVPGPPGGKRESLRAVQPPGGGAGRSSPGAA